MRAIALKITTKNERIIELSGSLEVVPVSVPVVVAVPVLELVPVQKLPINKDLIFTKLLPAHVYLH